MESLRRAYVGADNVEGSPVSKLTTDPVRRPQRREGQGVHYTQKMRTRAHFVSDTGPVKKPSQTPHEESETETERTRQGASEREQLAHGAAMEARGTGIGPGRARGEKKAEEDAPQCREGRHLDLKGRTHRSARGGTHISALNSKQTQTNSTQLKFNFNSFI